MGGPNVASGGRLANRQDSDACPRECRRSRSLAPPGSRSTAGSRRRATKRDGANSNTDQRARVHRTAAFSARRSPAPQRVGQPSASAFAGVTGIIQCSYRGVVFAGACLPRIRASARCVSGAPSRDVAVACSNTRWMCSSARVGRHRVAGARRLRRRGSAPARWRRRRPAGEIVRPFLHRARRWRCCQSRSARHADVGPRLARGPATKAVAVAQPQVEQANAAARGCASASATEPTAVT